MIKQRKRLGNRPKAFWGSLIPSLISSVANVASGIITTSAQARAQKRALEQQEQLAQQQAQISRNNQLANTLNNSADANESYNNSDQYNIKYRNGGVKHIGSSNIVITDGGNAKRIGRNTYLLRGGSHETINSTGQTGIGINVGGNEIEAEGGEVAQRKGNALRIFSAQPILNGISPAQAVKAGANKDSIFAAQQRFKKNNDLNDDGTKYKWGTEDYINAAKVVGSYLPVIGTLQDAYELYQNPSLEQAGWTALGLVSDLFGGRAIVKGLKTARLASKAYKANKNIINARRMINAKNYRNNNIVYGFLMPGTDNMVQRNIVDPLKQRYGGLTSNDRGSSKHSYPSVSSNDFAGGNRSYPIPTKADAIDALRLAGLHGRNDVRTKVYNRYPSLRKKADLGTWARTNRDNNLLASALYESGLTDINAWREMLRDIHTFTGMGADPYNDNSANEAVMTPAFGTSSTRQFANLAKTPEASYTLKQTLGLPNKQMIRKRIAGDIAKRIGKSRAASRASRIRNYNIAKMQAANAEASFSPLTNRVRYTTGQPILVDTKGFYTTAGKTIERNAKNMTNGANPFLYTPKSSFEIKAGLNRGFEAIKQRARNVGQKVINSDTYRTYSGSKGRYNFTIDPIEIKAGLNRGFEAIKQRARNVGQKVINSDTYRTYTGSKGRYNSTIGGIEITPTYKLKPWVKAAAGTAGIGAGAGLIYGLSQVKNKDNKLKAQLDTNGQPISSYIAKLQELTKQQSRSQVKKTPPARRDTARIDTVKQANKVVPRQVKTAPQYTGNVTKGNYQLHDGETKTINGVKYTRRGNTIINHKTNVGYVYDKNGNYTGQADYSKVGNFNQAFDAARAAGRSNFIYRAGKYQNYSTAKETDVKKEALNRKIGAKRIAKKLGGNLPVRGMRPKAELGDLTYTRPYKYSFENINNNALLNNQIFNGLYKPNSVTSDNTPYLGRQSEFKPATQDYIGLGIDTLATLGSGLFTRSAYNNLNFDYSLPNYVDETPVAFDTTYHNEAQRANIERNRINARNIISGNTSSAQAALTRMQQSDTNALMETNKLLDEKSNKEVELRNQNAANEQAVRARNAAARNQYYQNVASIKNAALQAKNEASLAKAQSIASDLSGLSQAWTNFATSVENRYNNRQNEAIIAATSKEPAVLSNALQFGYNFSPEILANIYRSSSNDKLKRLALSRLSNSERRKFGIV